jgi:acetyl esterase/lipase/HEAT repeat protein
MKLKIQQFASLAICVALTTSALAAEKQTASVEKAREAIAVLKSGTEPAEKALACKTLAVYGKADAVPALAPLLEDEHLASWARIALEVIPGRAADKALRDAMGKVHGMFLVGVINSIGVRRDAKAVSALSAELKGANAEVASAAAVALGHIGGDKSAKVLKQALVDGSETVRSAAAQGCELCAEQYIEKKKSAKAAELYGAVRKANVPKQRMLEATRGMILVRQSDGIPLLLETLRSSDNAVFAMGLRTSRELGGSKVTEALVAELAKTPSERQGPLLVAIADRNDAVGLPVVISSARSGSKSLRLVAIEMMARLGNVACVPALLDAVVASDTEIAQAAKTSLAALPADDVNPQLRARLTQAAGTSRYALVKLAGERQVTAAVPELTKAANDSDSTIRAAGVKALGETVDVDELSTLTDLLAKAKSDDEISAVQDALESACARIKEKAACTKKLVPLLASSATPAKCALLHVLGVVATPRALNVVKSSIGSQDATVRDAAIRVLADWSEPAGLPPLLEVFRGTLDETHRFLVLRGCVRLLDLDTESPAQKVKIYGELLASTQRADDRKVILSGLANVADPDALKLVEPLLDDAEVKAEAKLAADKISAALKKSAPAATKPKPKRRAKAKLKPDAPESFSPRPTLADVAYGKHPKQVLHFWKAESDKPTPLLFFIHGGGWQAGDRSSGLAPLLRDFLNAGISVVSVEYRFIDESTADGEVPPVKGPLHDAARALQFVRSKAGEWNIDKKRIAASGGSAGACTSLWLAFHPDLADPQSSDPVARESTRLWCAAVMGPQTTLDPEQMVEWTPNSRYGGHAFGFTEDKTKTFNDELERTQSRFAAFLAGRDKILPWIAEYSPYALVTADDPPIWMIFNKPPALGKDQDDPTHTANFGVKLQERLRSVGVECELVYPGAPDVKHKTVQDYLIEKLKSPDK